MKKITHTIITYTIWALIFTASSYAYAAWSEPTCTNPSTCNTSGPITVSSTSQTKTGFLWSAGLGSTAGGYFSTFIGVGVSSTTNPTTLGLTGLFNGKVGGTSFCNTSGSNCINPDSQKVVYITNSSNVYRKESIQYGDYRGGSVGSLSLSKSEDISLNAIKAVSPEFAAETRTIKAILVNYYGYFIAGNSNASNLWYILSWFSSSGDWITPNDTRAIFYDYSSTSGSLPAGGGPILVSDKNSNGSFSLTWNLSRQAIANVDASVDFKVFLDVIGYITE